MSAAPVDAGAGNDRDRHFTANVITSLREDYRLRTDEAERAVSLFLRRKAGWSTPDQTAFEAYQWWTPTVEPAVVLAREAEQRAHATGTAVGTGLSQAGDPRFGFDPQTTSETFADLESALSMVRTKGDNDGFTTDHLALALQLRELLDQSPVWDTITPHTTVQDRVAVPPLEPALQPETVRPNDDRDDIIALDAAFAGRTITVLRPPGTTGTTGYVFLTTVPNHPGTMEGADNTKMGLIASGDATPDPAHAANYDALGQQVRRHLMGLVDAVAESRELRQEQETRRRNAALPTLGAPVEATHRRPQPTRGLGR